MRLSDVGMCCRPTKLIYPNHRFPPCLTEDATRDPRADCWATRRDLQTRSKHAADKSKGVRERQSRGGTTIHSDYQNTGPCPTPQSTHTGVTISHMECARLEIFSVWPGRSGVHAVAHAQAFAGNVLSLRQPVGYRAPPTFSENGLPASLVRQLAAVIHDAPANYRAQHFGCRNLIRRNAQEVPVQDNEIRQFTDFERPD